MKVPEQERRDWIMIPLILGIGFLCVIIAGQWALRFSPSWKLNADMDSNLDPNSDFLTRRPSGFIEPVDPSILTQPVWINLFLTPGAQFSTRAVIPITASPYLTKLTATQTPFSITTSTNTNIAIASPTNTFVYYPPTSQPKPTATSTVSPIYTSTPTAAVTSSWTSTPTPTQSPTGTSTPLSTLTSTATQTPTNTPDPSEPEFGGPDGNTATLGNGAWVEFNLSGFLLDGNSAWDAVYYEMEEASSAGKIHLGAVKIEVYDQTTTAWYEIYNWGDGIADSNASYNNGNSEPDGFPIDQSLLYGAPPLNTGIAMDIDIPVQGQGGSIGDSITKIRVTSLSSSNCEIDALQMLR